MLLHPSQPIKAPIIFSPHHQITPVKSHELAFISSTKPPKLSTKLLLAYPNSTPCPHFSTCRALGIDQSETPNSQAISTEQPATKKNFWAAVSLIVGTAVGPGMLGLPSATLKSGPIPSTVAIVLSWLYVVSSIILVAELSFATMREANVQEVSFTSLASIAFGPDFGAFVAIIYACLSFSLLIACVSGIGSLIMQQFPLVNPVISHSLIPVVVAILIAFFPFKAIDLTNRLLCSLMLFSITALVLTGLSVGRSNLSGSLNFASWSLQSIMPAIPVTVLTLGFHVITPFVCKIVGDSAHDARKAILFGGAVPLVMVLSWNAVVLGLAGNGKESFVQPIELLLSVNAAALPAIRGFAFAALATSLIGYAVSFPKQLVDTLRLIGERFRRKEVVIEEENRSAEIDGDGSGVLVTWLVLIVPIFVAALFPTAFSKALDFAGVYANCFLFGVLPPAMVWIHRSNRMRR